MNDLRGAVALVTGGARGLGEATCRVLAEAGARVVVADIREEQAQTVAASICAAGGEALALPLDVTDPRSAEEAVRRVVDERGALDVLVNAAGIDVTAAAEELSAEQWRKILAVNLDGPFFLSRAALPQMREQGRGHIVNIASTAAKRAWANASAYHASKWGVLGLSHALHVEARAYGVKVTAVVSGGMRTDFLFERFPDLDPGLLQDPRTVAETIRYALLLPDESVIPELTVLPMRETSWP